VVRGHPRSLKIAPFDRAHMNISVFLDGSMDYDFFC